MKKLEKIVCIGSSAASLSCVAQLRRLDKDVSITMLTAQVERPNNTCFLANYVAGTSAKELLYLPVPENITIHYNCQVIAVNATLRKVTTKNGQEYYYDKLFIGTGLKAMVPGVFLSDLYTKIFPFKVLEDILEFERLESKFAHKSVLIVGGGVTGIEASEAFLTRGYRVTLIEKNAQLLANFNNPEVSEEIYELLIKNGVKIILSADAFNIVKDCDGAVFLAMGGKPELDFLKNQVKLENGFIVVDEFQQTSDPNIFAGGDVCVGRSLWNHALKDGKRAAEYMLENSVQPARFNGQSIVIKIFGKMYTLSK